MIVGKTARPIGGLDLGRLLSNSGTSRSKPDLLLEALERLLYAVRELEGIDRWTSPSSVR